MWIVWLLAFTVLPLAGLGYVSWHIWQLLPVSTMWHWIVVGLCVCLFLLMVGGFLGLNERLPLNVATVSYEVGNSVVFALLYLVMIFAVLDLAHVAHLIPKAWLHNNWYTALAIAVVTVGVFGYGNLHYYNKHREAFNFNTSKAISKNPHVTSKKIVLLSDLHLGYHNRRAEFARWVDIINAEKPDLILIGGDIIDVSVRPLIMESVAEEFHRLKAPIYACLGNHEYYSGEPKAQQFYKEAGIILLRDSVAEIDNICIIGRDDRTNAHRKSLSELTNDLNDSCFSILLDHQPYHLEEAQKARIDFQFSGHTHDGQVWPVSWITRAMYEKSFGYLTKGDTQYYISSGMGIWGAKFRIGTRSEYMVLTLNFSPSEKSKGDKSR